MHTNDIGKNDRKN